MLLGSIYTFPFAQIILKEVDISPYTETTKWFHLQFREITKLFLVLSFNRQSHGHNFNIKIVQLGPKSKG